MLTLQTSQTLTFGLAQNWRQNPKFYHIPSYSHIFPYIPQHVHHVSPGEIQDHPKVCAFALVLLLYFSAAHSSCERSLAWCHGWSFVKFVDINFWLSILVSRCSSLVLQPQTFRSSQLNTLGTWTSYSHHHHARPGRTLSLWGSFKPKNLARASRDA